MIGVIGGNGVAATNKLCQLIEEKMVMEGAYRDAHHPEIIIWQATQAPSRSMYLEGRGPSWIEDYVGIGKKLKECGCTELCMFCNTAHYAVNLIEKEIGLPFINLLSLVAEQCFSLGVKRIGMMC
jgi:aspartate racemase